MIDVLFITRIGHAQDNMLKEFNEDDIWLKIDGEVANMPHLKQLVSKKENVKELQSRIDLETETFGVLTGIYIENYLNKKGITFKEILCFNDEFDKVRNYLSEGVRLIAISSTWPSTLHAAEEFRNAARRLRKIAPNVPIVAGGINARKGFMLRKVLADRDLTGIVPDWFYNNAFTKPVADYLLEKELSKYYLAVNAKADSCFDALVICEGGEKTLANIVEKLKEGRDFKELPNLAVPKEKKYYFTPSIPENVDINSEIIDWSRYMYREGHWLEYPIRYGTGCPHKCGFCDFIRLQKQAFRSPESIVKELKTLFTRDNERKSLYFTDDNLGLTKKRLTDISKAIIKEKLNVSWRALLRADMMDKETVSLLKEAGCLEVLLGIESGDGNVLRNMNKHLDPDSALKGIMNLNEAGIRTINTFVIGYPGENVNSIQKTIDFISSIPSGNNASVVHRYYLFPFIVFPLAVVAGREMRAKFKLRGVGENWRHSTMNSKEARKAIKEMFLKIKGISHVYHEFLTEEWSESSIKEVLELRDRVKKSIVSGQKGESIQDLLNTVKCIEQM
jgi:radical SAM superfamily enzyme YgiQ (UPF0313 family)